MSVTTGSQNPTPAAAPAAQTETPPASPGAAAASDNSGDTAGAGQKQGGTLLTGNNETNPPNGDNQPPASRDDGSAAPKQRPAWKAQASKELQDDARLDRFGTISELGKSYLELEGKIGRSVEIPGDDATAEDWEAYHKRIGRPETPDAYQFEKQALPEGAAYSPELEAAFRTEAFAAGLTDKQAQAVWNLQTRIVAAQVSQQAEAKAAELENTKAEIRKLYGANADHELAVTQKFMRGLAEKVSPGICQKVEASGLGNSVELLKLMNHFAHRTVEDSFIRNGEGSAVGSGRFEYNLPERR